MAVNVTRSSMPSFEEYCEEIKELWESHWLTNMGIKHQTLEKELEKKFNVNNVCLFTNGHLALEVAISALDLKGEIITTPYTFASTTNAIVRCGCEPVFCDINEKDYTIDVTKIEKLITDKTVAIMPVHVYGNLCDVEAIDRIAKKYNLKVIYDAAHAFNESYKGVSVANFGDISMFSFHATKVFNTIEGGCLTFNDNTLRTKINNLKNFGITSPESVGYIGGNAKMNEFQAAMGLCNLRHLESEILKRKKVVERYIDRLKNVSGLRLSLDQENVDYNYSYFPVIFDGYKYDRNEVFERLAKEGITARKYFYPITNSFEAFKGKYDVNKTPIALKMADKVLTLPLYADLELDIVDKICDIILK